MNCECLLSTLPGSSETERVVVLLLQMDDGSSKISLRQQNWAEGIGWYDQKSLDLEPEQFRQLRRGPASSVVRQSLPPSDDVTTLPFPGLVRVESA
jgi:hypothetical protein